MEHFKFTWFGHVSQMEDASSMLYPGFDNRKELEGAKSCSFTHEKDFWTKRGEQENHLGLNENQKSLYLLAVSALTLPPQRQKKTSWGLKCANGKHQSKQNAGKKRETHKTSHNIVRWTQSHNMCCWLLWCQCHQLSDQALSVSNWLMKSPTTIASVSYQDD